MTFIVYAPLTEDGNFEDVKVIDFIEAESYDYKKHRYEIGRFTLVVPNTVNGIRQVQKDMLLFVIDDYVNDSLVITAVKDDGEHTTLSGYDLKAMLKWRVTLFPPEEIEAGTYGYDVATGSTGQIIEHYIDYNLGENADEDRRIYGIAFGDIASGLVDDTYMSRMQPVNEVVEALCKNADIGYSVDIVREGETPGYIVTVSEGVDRTNGQSQNAKMVFADYTFSADSITAETSSEERRNIIWAINGGTVDEATVTAVNNSDEENAPTGFVRREAVTTVNCETEDVEIYAKKDMDDSTDKTEIQVQASLYSNYGTRYNIGDKVTAIKNGVAYDRRVLAVEKNYNGSGKRVVLTLGEIPERKVIARLNYETSKNKQEAITQRLDGPAGGGSSGVGEDIGNNSERFNDYEDNTSAGGSYHHLEGHQNSITSGGYCGHIGGYNNTIAQLEESIIHGRDGTIGRAYCALIIGDDIAVGNINVGLVSGKEHQGVAYNVIVGGRGHTLSNSQDGIVTGYHNTDAGSENAISGANNTVSSNYNIVGGSGNSVSGSNNNIVSGEVNYVNGIRSLVVGGNHGTSSNKIDPMDSIICGYSHNGSINYGIVCGVNADLTYSTVNRIVVGNGTGGTASNCFRVDNQGNVYATAYNTSGADYAEYFEWADGNPDGEDRRGLLVQLAAPIWDDKFLCYVSDGTIEPANGDDILGAVSACPSVVGNAYEDEWRGKYKRDIYGDYIRDADGKRQLSDDYDKTREYIPRSQRPEWAAVGMIGRLIICDNGKCQPGGYVTARGGVGYPTFTKTNVRVLRRINETHIEVLIK